VVFKPNKKLYIFSVDEGAGAHCQMNNFTLMSQVVYDWLDERVSKKMG